MIDNGMVGIDKKLRGLHHMIGNTPLLAIAFEYGGTERVIYAKSEQMNLTGSIKDRMALYILQDAYRQGRIKPGDVIAEATSGNTGIAFAALGRMLGHEVRIFMPDWMSQERVDMIRSLGAQIRPVTREEGGFLGSIALAEALAEANGDIFLPRQFANEANIGAHLLTTGPEIASQLESEGVVPAAFVAGVGTGGTVMGVGRALRQRYPQIQIHPLEPLESPTLSVGRKVGKHRIQGISDEFVPEIVKLRELDEVVQVSDGDAILMAQNLARSLGLAVGISSGANFLGALQVQNKLGDDVPVVTVFPDDNKKYLSTDLLQEEPIKLGYMAPGVALKSVRALMRVCAVCFGG
ncbi:MAG TPA: cysteine synthase family protein [Anaerolineae bacterium]|nr:cysteine synthase family protein [Anaerolineae bacterium]